MNNFLKSECYKVSHRAYPYTLLIIGVVIAIFINVSVWYAIHVIRIPFTIEGADIMNAGLYMMATIVWYCIIFTTDIGFSGEWRNNTMKNIVSFGTSRNTIFFGKCIVNTLLLLIGIVVVSAAYLLTNYICFRHDGSLTASAYQNYFLRFVIMLPMIIAGQTMASSLCMFFSTDLLWCGIYAVVVALLPNGIMLFLCHFPGSRSTPYHLHQSSYRLPDRCCMADTNHRPDCSRYGDRRRTSDPANCYFPVGVPEEGDKIKTDTHPTLRHDMHLFLYFIWIVLIIPLRSMIQDRPVCHLW